jgi:hypothetical protein
MRSATAYRDGRRPAEEQGRGRYEDEMRWDDGSQLGTASESPSSEIDRSADGFQAGTRFGTERQRLARAEREWWIQSAQCIRALRLRRLGLRDRSVSDTYTANHSSNHSYILHPSFTLQYCTCIQRMCITRERTFGRHYRSFPFLLASTTFTAVFLVPDLSLWCTR